MSPIRFTDIGEKLEITERIAHFLDTGEVIAAKKVQKKSQIIGARALTRLLSAGNIKNSCRGIIVMRKATLMYWKNNLLHFKQ